MASNIDLAGLADGWLALATLRYASNEGSSASGAKNLKKLGDLNRFRRQQLATISLLASGLLAACEPADDRSASAPPPPPVVSVAAVAEKSVTESTSFVGRVEAVDEVEIRARVDGFLLERAFAEGGDVEEGQLLFLIDPAEFEASLDLAKANVAQARAQVVEAGKTLKRNESLLSRGNVSRATYDEAVARRDSAAAVLQAREADQRQAQIQIDYTTILSPLSGHIGSAAHSAGSLVGPDAGVLATVTKLDPIYVNFALSERDYVGLRRDQAVGGSQSGTDYKPKLRLPDGTDYATPGAFDLIGDRVDPDTGTVEVRAVFPNPDRLLLPGQFVTVIVESARPAAKLVVPQAAVQEDQQGPFVLVVGGDDTVSQRPIVTGGKDNFDWVVEGGLQKGETVIVEGLQKVRPGVTVQPVAATSSGTNG